ncbi:hypothetical protein LC147_26070 [Vibrio harveyi]|uniref:MBL fold metallo-hydrolase RNA specificity domain-containing protein n=1 Tax=Vibrio harveyi TaxID=669 RepID=UPI003BB66D5F
MKAQIHTISSYSSHANESDLIHFVKRINPQLKEAHLIRSDKKVKRVLHFNLIAKRSIIVKQASATRVFYRFENTF